MRISPLRHPLAVLRITVGLRQKEMAALVKRAAVTIQAVELGKLPLSERLAQEIADATGVEVGWLLGGDPAALPRNAAGGLYGRVDYERHRASLEVPAGASPAGREGDRELVAATERFLAATAGAPGGELVRWKLRRLLTTLSAEHGKTWTSTKGAQ